MNRLIFATLASLSLFASPALAATPATTQSSPRATIASRQLYLQNANVLDDEASITIGERVEQIGRERIGRGIDTLGAWYSVNRVIGGPSEELGITIDLTKRKADANPAGLFNSPVSSAEGAASIPPVAAEIADAAVQFVRDYVVQRNDRHREELMQRATKAVDVSRGPAANAESKTKALRQNLRDMSGRADVSPTKLYAAMSAMDQQLQQFQLERLSKDSRRKAVEEELAKVSERVQKSVQSDAIATELQKVVDARDERVKTIQKMAASGHAGTSEVSDAIAAAAESRAKMLQQQRDAAAAAGGNILEKLNQELIALSIDSRELEATVKYLEERLPGLRSSVELLDEFEAAHEEAQRTSEALRKAEAELQKTRRQLEDLPEPRVLIRDSANRLAE